MAALRYSTADAHRLMLEGAVALSQVEANGMRVDVDYLQRTIGETESRIADLTDTLTKTEEWAVWRRTCRDNANLGSRQQLARVLFDVMGHKRAVDSDGVAKSGADEDALLRIDTPFVHQYLRLEKLKKLKSTYLQGVLREVVGGYLHPSFNLHLVLTWRSSSDSPNFQNLPIRDPELGKLIRSAFIPRPGHVIIELDYKAIEVRVAACYHRDPTMLTYIEDNYDMHHDMAAECFLLPDNEVSKPARGAAKGGFVFAEFYGDWYVSVCQNLWNAIATDKLMTKSGVPMYDHLARCGIRELGACNPRQRAQPGTFEAHIRDVEQRFWGDRFPIYAQWKLDWHAKYLQHGWYPLKTGFVAHGVYKKNEVINAPIQGSAFHCLLWSLIRLNGELRQRRMGAKIVGQIHDSLIADVPEHEVQDYLALSHQIMTKDLRDAWRWLITPIEIEAEASGTTWHDKQPIAIAV